MVSPPPYSILARAIEADLLPVAQKYGLAVLPWSPLAGGWLSGAYRKGRDVPTSTRARRVPARFDLGDPGNQAKLEAVESLAVLAERSGMGPVHLALAFVLQHPAVTASIIGPRTVHHLDSQLDAANMSLTAEVLDAIDDIVAPGVTLLRADAGYLPPALTVQALRRRDPV